MKFTGTQLMLLSAASQREDGAIVLAPNPKGGATNKSGGKLRRGGPIEDVPAGGLLPACRPMTPVYCDRLPDKVWQALALKAARYSRPGKPNRPGKGRAFHPIILGGRRPGIGLDPLSQKKQAHLGELTGEKEKGRAPRSWRSP
jgi:hypothetical protein